MPYSYGTSIAFLASEQDFLAVDYDGIAHLINRDRPAALRTTPRRETTFDDVDTNSYCLALSEPGKVFAVGYSDGAVSVFALDTFDSLHSITIGDGIVGSLQFSWNSGDILIGAKSGCVAYRYADGLAGKYYSEANHSSILFCLEISKGSGKSMNVKAAVSGTIFVAPCFFDWQLRPSSLGRCSLDNQRVQRACGRHSWRPPKALRRWNQARRTCWTRLRTHCSLSLSAPPPSSLRKPALQPSQSSRTQWHRFRPWRCSQCLHQRWIWRLTTWI
eukprot:m.386770 g.386770  ORF g.386770 m.386770 type:complete len:274 (+) comp56305_c1_seq33:393-1214(+)